MNATMRRSAIGALRNRVRRSAVFPCLKSMPAISLTCCVDITPECGSECELADCINLRFVCASVGSGLRVTLIAFVTLLCSQSQLCDLFLPAGAGANGGCVLH